MLNGRRKLYVRRKRIRKAEATVSEKCGRATKEEEKEVGFGYYGQATDPRSQRAEEYRRDCIQFGRLVAESERRRREELAAKKNIADEDSAAKPHAAEIRKIFDPNYDENIEKILSDIRAKAPLSPLPSPDADDDEFLTIHEKEEIKSMEENWEKNSVSFDLKFARMALSFYNEHHKTNYKLTRTLGCNGYETWRHCNFEAKLTPLCNCAVDTLREVEKEPINAASSPKLFFAEVQCRYFSSYEVKRCCILDDENTVCRRCIVCRYPLAHPVDGFEAGRLLQESDLILKFA